MIYSFHFIINLCIFCQNRTESVGFIYSISWYFMTLVFKLMGPVNVKCTYVCMEWV